jgi:hypothetical protein
MKKHTHTLLQRTPIARLEVCHECRQLPYILRTRDGLTARLLTERFYDDRAAAMAAYQDERRRG